MFTVQIVLYSHGHFIKRSWWMMRLSARASKCVCVHVWAAWRAGRRAGSEMDVGWQGWRMSPNLLLGSVKRCMHTQACKSLDAHMVDVICWSLLQTRRCCVELTNSPVSPAGCLVWIITAISGHFVQEKGKPPTPSLFKCGADRYCRCFSLCMFRVAALCLIGMIHVFLFCLCI